MNRATIISAIFIGEHRSLGYYNGVRYELNITDTGGKICISRRDGNGGFDGGFCPYDTINSFLRNWTSIENLDQ